MESYLRIPFVEIEVRLGTFTGNKFDSSVDRKYFEYILFELNLMVHGKILFSKNQLII